MQSYTLLYRYRFWSVIVHIADLVLKRSCVTKFIKILACEQALRGAVAEGREMEGELTCEQALLFGRAERAARQRASERRGREKDSSRVLSRASRLCTFHDIPQMDSLLEG